MSLSGASRVAGVVGRPIVHSMSPILHNAWLAAAGIDGVYAPFSTEPGRFTAFAQSLRGGVKLLRAFGECLRILRRRGADAVLGMGGYVCVPGGVSSPMPIRITPYMRCG